MLSRKNTLKRNAALSFCHMSCCTFPAKSRPWTNGTHTEQCIRRNSLLSYGLVFLQYNLLILEKICWGKCPVLRPQDLTKYPDNMKLTLWLYISTTCSHLETCLIQNLEPWFALIGSESFQLSEKCNVCKQANIREFIYLRPSNLIKSILVHTLVDDSKLVYVLLFCSLRVGGLWIRWPLFYTLVTNPGSRWVFIKLICLSTCQG